MSSSVLRGSSLRMAPFTARPAKASGASRARVVTVEANKRVSKRTKVILTKTHEGIGEEGEIRNVPLGYWRNFLKPSGVAKIADDSILEAIRKKKEDEIRAKLELKAQAKAFSQALSTIGKFSIKKKVGDKDQIFGSVSVKDVADAIYQQTGKQIQEADIKIPDIKSVGTYECTAKLHKDVTATFSVVIVKDKSLTIKGKK
uniref:Large ribosomal subunit protein bL9c n=1 Tax=Chlamydomonas euryale TaxID=1486919 RepID=A0A7R9YSE6_9CHLO